MIFLSVLPILASASYGIRLFRPSPKRAGAWLAPPVKMRLAALLCHCRSWIQGSHFREQLFRFGGSIPEFPDENPLGDPQRANPVATMSPANCLRASADDRTILGASFVHSLVAPQVANRTSGLLAATNVLVGGSFDWIISAGVMINGPIVALDFPQHGRKAYAATYDADSR